MPTTYRTVTLSCLQCGLSLRYKVAAPQTQHDRRTWPVPGCPRCRELEVLALEAEFAREGQLPVLPADPCFNPELDEDGKFKTAPNHKALPGP